MKLASYVGGDWAEGSGGGVALTDPVLGDELARASSEGIDIGSAMDYGRKTGGPALRRLSFAQRGNDNFHSHPGFTFPSTVSTYFHRRVTHLTALRVLRLGAWSAVMPVHHKGRATRA